ncbi:hypothetical protein [Roseovarius salinarum]|uniref:hypothetical protein n=1 Tax=Roseovarius salinarum TaxID=1981892 RepID=UPI0012FFFD1C|nr:hypothetical protein [Roseovarius salinarum]
MDIKRSELLLPALFAGLSHGDEQGDNLQRMAASRHRARFSRATAKVDERHRTMGGAAV